MPVGSSPRMRGKLACQGIGFFSEGLILACAGKTYRRADPSPFRRAHPRVCGENRRARWDAGIAWGSSPRVRGKQAREGYPFLFDGLIPACAGKTRTAPSTASASEAHPRVCGENRPLLAPYVPLGGSSPRVRGKLPN